MEKSIYIFRRIQDTHLKEYENKNVIELVMNKTGKSLQEIEAAHTDELYVWLNDTYKTIDKFFLIMTNREYEIALHYCKRYGLIGEYFLEYNREHYEFVNAVYHFEGRWGVSFKPYHGNIYLVKLAKGNIANGEKDGGELPYDRAGIQTVLEMQDAQLLLDFDNQYNKPMPLDKYREYITNRAGIKRWFDMPLQELYEYTKRTYKAIDEEYEVVLQDEYERLYRDNKDYKTLGVVSCMQRNNKTEAVYITEEKVCQTLTMDNEKILDKKKRGRPKKS